MHGTNQLRTHDFADVLNAITYCFGARCFDSTASSSLRAAEEILVEFYGPEANGLRAFSGTKK